MDSRTAAAYLQMKDVYNKQYDEIAKMSDQEFYNWWTSNVGDWEGYATAGNGWADGTLFAGLSQLGNLSQTQNYYTGHGSTRLWSGDNLAYQGYLKKLADLRNARSGINPDSWLNPTDESELSDAAGKNIQHEDQKANENLVDAQDAMKQGALQAQQVAENTAKNAAAAGVSKSQAGTLSDNAAQQTQTQSAASYAAANAAQRASTQADYMEKMQKVAELQNQAMLSKKAEGANIWSAALQGGATGLMFANNMLSDERMKEPPKAPRAGNKERSCPKGMLNDSLDEKEMRKMIKQFKDLYTRVKSLKEAK